MLKQLKQPVDVTYSLPQPSTLRDVSRALTNPFHREKLGGKAWLSRRGTTEEQMAKVAVKAHKYGAMNPYPHFRREITVEKALKSRVITWPLKLYDCCPISEGAAAVILASEDILKEFEVETPVWVDGIGFSSDISNMCIRGDYVGLGATVRASQMAYERAKITSQKVDVGTVHDCFTIAEILAYEDLGFCEKGEGGKLLDEGQTEIGGKIPVNVDGGLKSKGHPLQQRAHKRI